MRNAPNLNSDHNAAIRAEIGERLRVLLSKEQPGPSPRIQHLLDRLRILDATGGRPKRSDIELNGPPQLAASFIRTKLTQRTQSLFAHSHCEPRQSRSVYSGRRRAPVSQENH